MSSASGELTEQEVVLQRMRETYGKTAYTVNHLNYRMVGFNGGKAIGDTWEQAINRLEKRARDLRSGKSL